MIYTNKSTTKFKLSDDGLYWIGTTSKGYTFWFNGNEDIVNYIKTCSWRRLNNGYFQNSKGERLHRVVMNVLNNTDVIINHLGGNKWDNRIEKLSISDCLDNSKEKIGYKNNNSGIIGLLKRRNKWVGNIKVNGVSLYSKYKEKDEALIDLLIMQKNYGFRHNENLYYLIDNISEERINEVLSICERQLNSKRNDKICSSNVIELSEDKTFYWVYDDNNNKFKISLEYKDKVLEGKWYVAKDNGKQCVHGSIVENGCRKMVRLHRFLFGITDKKYRHWYISHDDGDCLNNTKENMIITDYSGNCITKPANKYYICGNRNKKYKSRITINKKTYSNSFYNKEDAIKWFDSMREKALKERIQFKTKDELDKYIENKLKNRGEVDEQTNS